MRRFRLSFCQLFFFGSGKFRRVFFGLQGRVQEISEIIIISSSSLDLSTARIRRLTFTKIVVLAELNYVQTLNIPSYRYTAIHQQDCNWQFFRFSRYEPWSSPHCNFLKARTYTSSMDFSCYNGLLTLTSSYRKWIWSLFR